MAVARPLPSWRCQASHVPASVGHCVCLDTVTVIRCLQAGVEEGVKGAVLSAFYWGYGISQVPHSVCTCRHACAFRACMHVAAPALAWPPCEPVQTRPQRLWAAAQQPCSRLRADGFPPRSRRTWRGRVNATRLTVGCWGLMHAHLGLAPPPIPTPHHAPTPFQIPGGWAAQRYGGERVLTLSFALWSLASLLTPGTAANTRSIAAARVCVGLSQVCAPPVVRLLWRGATVGQQCAAVRSRAQQCAAGLTPLQSIRSWLPKHTAHCRNPAARR